MYSNSVNFNDGSRPSAVGQVGEPAVPGLVVKNSSGIYWAENVSDCGASANGCNVFEYDLQTCAIRSVIDFPAGEGAQGLFVDDTHLYYSSGDSNGRNGDIGVIGLNPGSSARRLAGVTGSVALKGIAKVDNFIFWGQNSSSSKQIRTVRIP